MKISSVLLALVLCAGTVQAAETVPANAVQHLPTLRTVIESHWADAARSGREKPLEVCRAGADALPSHLC